MEVEVAKVENRKSVQAAKLIAIENSVTALAQAKGEARIPPITRDDLRTMLETEFLPQIRGMNEMSNQRDLAKAIESLNLVNKLSDEVTAQQKEMEAMQKELKASNAELKASHAEAAEAKGRCAVLEMLVSHSKVSAAALCVCGAGVMGQE